MRHDASTPLKLPYRHIVWVLAMNWALECCCHRKSRMHREMAAFQSDDAQPDSSSDRRLSDVYELVMTPCETSVDLPDTPPSPPNARLAKRKDVYVNFFSEPTSPSGATTPILLTPRTPDVHETVIHLEIPKGSEVYVNYEPFHFHA